MFEIRSKNESILEPVVKANILISDPKFKTKLANKKSFDMATCDGHHILKLIENNRRFLYVHTYRSRNPWSKAYGYYSPATPNNIYLNTRKLNRSTGSIVASLIHELIHWLDHYDTQHSFGHGDNNPTGKQNTAPYWIDNIAEALIDNKEPDFNNTDNSKIKYYVPWYKRLWRLIF